MFPDGAVNGDTECINIEILQDNVFEGDHSFQVTIMGTEPPGLNIDVTPDRAAINIMDDDGEMVHH